MLNIASFIKKSDIHGLGLFADQDIPRGTIIGEFVFGIDISLSAEEYENLKSEYRIFFDQYGWKDKISGKYMLNIDNTRFINHSETPNILHDEYKIIAAKDIKKGEELTDNYSDFDQGLAINGLQNGY